MHLAKAAKLLEYNAVLKRKSDPNQGKLIAQLLKVIGSYYKEELNEVTDE